MLSDLRRVRSFVAVADELQFRRGAEQQHFSQPALTSTSASWGRRSSSS